MSPAIKPTPVDCTSTWPYPVENDGWYRAHNALRADLEALDGMLRTFDDQLEAKKTLTRSQAAAATRFFNCFLKFLHHHHHNEDDIATPYMATRCQVPVKIAADHQELDALLDHFETALKKLLASDHPSVQRVLCTATQAAFTELRALLEPHLREEEEEAMPLMRRHFTPDEIKKNVVQKIMRSMDEESVGVFLRSMSRAERRAFAKQEGIPFFIRWILFRRAAKYEQAVWQPFQRECLRVML
ncbi:hypothetical protein D9Q98_009492 [Chlorella vulgaris]|uniref:Hemerythrin-like domain-containing protein n=1 Tax=Chlorella vulgaris TaxID=3077 RepID=A0A9D4YSE7_CHLVU|nr:hypothetical protein D9Q98_009492 [Chlorella vulgaris]